MVTYSKYGRLANSKEIGKNRIAIHDAEKTASKSYIVKNNYGFSITDFNKGVALYKNMYLGLFSIEDVPKYITWLSNNEVNFKKDDLDTGMAFAKRYIKINDTSEGLEYRGNFDENNFFNEWNVAIKEGKKNGK